MASLSVYDISILCVLESTEMSKLSSLKLYNQFMEPEELFKKPRIAFNMLAAGNNPTSAQLTQIRDFKENSNME